MARFLEFFAGRIANARTRAAYGRAVGQFLAWCEARGLRLRDVSPLHVAAYIRTHAPTVKQHLAAIQQAAAAFRNALGTEPPATLMFVPVPPSRGHRVTRMLWAMWSGRGIGGRRGPRRGP